MSIGSWLSTGLGAFQIGAGAVLTATGAGAAVGVPLIASGAATTMGGIASTTKEAEEAKNTQAQKNLATAQTVAPATANDEVARAMGIPV